jgi:hypothetical protein
MGVELPAVEHQHGSSQEMHCVHYVIHTAEAFVTGPNTRQVQQPCRKLWCTHLRRVETTCFMVAMSRAAPSSSDTLLAEWILTMMWRWCSMHNMSDYIGLALHLHKVPLRKECSFAPACVA